MVHQGFKKLAHFAFKFLQATRVIIHILEAIREFFRIHGWSKGQLTHDPLNQEGGCVELTAFPKDNLNSSKSRVWVYCVEGVRI